MVTKLNPVKTGEEMRTEREACNMTLRAMAKRLNLSPAYLCDLEKGRRSWTVERKKQYERVLHKAQIIKMMG